MYALACRWSDLGSDDDEWRSSSTEADNDDDDSTDEDRLGKGVKGVGKGRSHVLHPPGPYSSRVKEQPLTLAKSRAAR